MGEVEPTPDHVPCRWCGKPISWDEICWTHDETGFADCGLIVSGGTLSGETGWIINPNLDVEENKPYSGKHAEPNPPWS